MTGFFKHYAIAIFLLIAVSGCSSYECASTNPDDLHEMVTVLLGDIEATHALGDVADLRDKAEVWRGRSDKAKDYHGCALTQAMEQGLNSADARQVGFLRNILILVDLVISEAAAASPDTRLGEQSLDGVGALLRVTKEALAEWEDSG